MSARAELSAYWERLDAWAVEHGLTRSTRPTCLHGLTGCNAYAPSNVREHADRCKGGISVDLLDHATLWLRDGRPAVLLAHVYAPGIGDPGREAWTERVTKYVAAFPGVTVWAGRSATDKLALYRPGSTVPVLYGAPGVDLEAFGASLDGRMRRP